MKCQRCENEDPAYFYKGHRGYYCRKCVSFKRVLLLEELDSFDYEISVGSSDYHFDYQLTRYQLEASRKCLSYLKQHDVLLHCICGAGKTEIVVESISYYLSLGLKVCYAIARKEVVIELGKRFSRIFDKAKVVSVYGNHHDELTADLIVCTCHQLYRYYRTFDLLILDEVDAFPLKDNETLINISINSCKSRIIFSTATVNDSLRKILSKRNYRTVELFIRPSLKPMVLPKLIYMNQYIAYICLYILLKTIKTQCIIFIPSKKMCMLLYKIFKNIISCTYVYSDLEYRDRNINDFKNKKYQFIFSTTVLERGVTIHDISVVIMDYLDVFDVGNIIQMIGRINRGIDDNNGKAYLLFDRYNKKIIDVMKYLKRANECL